MEKFDVREILPSFSPVLVLVVSGFPSALPTDQVRVVPP